MFSSCPRVGSLEQGPLLKERLGVDGDLDPIPISKTWLNIFTVPDAIHDLKNLSSSFKRICSFSGGIQGKMPREKDPFRGYVDFLENNSNNNKKIWMCKFCNKEYQGSVTRIKAHLAGVGGFGINECKAVDGRVRSEARKALKGKGAAESTNRSEENTGEGLHQPVTANNEDARRETSSAAMSSLNLDGATSLDYLSLPGTNLPNQSLPHQSVIQQADALFWTQPPQFHATDSYSQLLNCSYPNSSRGLPPEALTNMPRPMNVVEGEPNPEVPQDARTDDALEDSPQPVTFGLVDKDMPTLKRKLISSPDADMQESMTLCRKAIKIAGECLNVVHAFRDGRSLAPRQVQRLEHLSEEVEDILGHCNFTEGSIARPAGCRKSLHLLTTELVGDESEETIKGICDYLMDDEISIIGIWGMGGVGKTAILMHVHNRELDNLHNSTFNDVFWVDVPEELNVYELQDEIANAVGLENISKHKAVKRRACTLNQHLMKKKKAVLILDGLWMNFDVEDVGIPVKKGGIKLVLATRSLHVCHKMLCKVHIKIEPLKELDSWRLFLDKLHFKGKLPAEIEKIARSIVKKCQGLPLGIIEIATCMRGVEEVHGWRDILWKLEDSRVELDVFKRLKLSYVKLDDFQAQQCFLHFMLCFGFKEHPLGEIHSIKEIASIESFIDEDLLGGFGTRQELHDKGNAILDKFRKDCLWEQKYPNVHPLIRDMALHMVDSTTHMVKASMGLKEIPEEKFWTSSLEKVFLQGNEIEDIPEGISPNCPKLTRLSLNFNIFLEDIHESFFRHLNGLKVVDLSNTGFTELPEAICHLESLEALLLGGCWELCHIPCVRKLGSLKKLDLTGCHSLEEVPEGMEALVKLRYLDLRETKIETLPEGVLQKLVNLQYLAIEKMRAGEEVKIKKVEELYCSIPDVETFNACVRLLEQNSSRQYGLALGASRHYLYDLQRRIMVIEGWHRIAVRGKRETGGNGCAVIPKNVQGLQIKRFGGVTSLCEVGDQLEELEELELLVIEEWEKLEELGGVHFRHLRELRITGRSKLKQLWGEGQVLPSLQSLEINGAKELEGIHLAAPRLERMTVSSCHKMKRVMEWESLITHLPNLKRISICHCEKVEEIIGGSFSFPNGATCLLETLEISECHNMKEVLRTHDVWPHLPSLQTIKVEICEGIEVIIGTAAPPNMTHSSSSSFFPKLKDLRLVYLPELKSICDGTLCCDSIQSIYLQNCPKLEGIPLRLPLLNDGTPYPPPSLREISINLQTLVIFGCYSIKGVLLTHDVWPHLPSLQKIEVRFCGGIEVIIGTAAPPNTTHSSSSNFPKLKDLHLWDLPELKSICDGILSCDSIERIQVGGCPRLKRIALQLPLPLSLQRFLIDRQTWQTLEWNDTLARSSFEPFIEFYKWSRGLSSERLTDRWKPQMTS